MTSFMDFVWGREWRNPIWIYWLCIKTRSSWCSWTWENIMTTEIMFGYWRTWRDMGRGQKSGTFWRSYGRGRRCAPEKMATMSPSSGRHAKPHKRYWHWRHYLIWWWKIWSGIGCLWQCSMTRLSTTCWYICCGPSLSIPWASLCDSLVFGTNCLNSCKSCRVWLYRGTIQGDRLTPPPLCWCCLSGFLPGPLPPRLFLLLTFRG